MKPRVFKAQRQVLKSYDWEKKTNMVLAKQNWLEAISALL